MGTAGWRRGGSFFLWGVLRPGVILVGEFEPELSIFSGALSLGCRRVILIFFDLSPVCGRAPLLASPSVVDSWTGCGTGGWRVWAIARIGPSSLQKKNLPSVNGTGNASSDLRFTLSGTSSSMSVCERFTPVRSFAWWFPVWKSTVTRRRDKITNGDPAFDPPSASLPVCAMNHFSMSLISSSAMTSPSRHALTSPSSQIAATRLSTTPAAKHRRTVVGEYMWIEKPGSSWNSATWFRRARRSCPAASMQMRPTRFSCWSMMDDSDAGVGAGSGVKVGAGDVGSSALRRNITQLFRIAKAAVSTRSLCIMWSTLRSRGSSVFSDSGFCSPSGSVCTKSFNSRLEVRAASNVMQRRMPPSNGDPEHASSSPTAAASIAFSFWSSCRATASRTSAFHASRRISSDDLTSLTNLQQGVPGLDLK